MNRGLNNPQCSHAKFAKDYVGAKKEHEKKKKKEGKEDGNKAKGDEKAGWFSPLSIFGECIYS